MRIFSYVIPRDYGFAPNPFFGICTLATCMPKIRRSAVVGDWVIGTSPAKIGVGKLIYAMKVVEKMTFNSYWADSRFIDKKPVMTKSLKKMYGDNIYFYDGAAWLQADSHHSNNDGSINTKNLNNDTSADAVLISNHFYYFGEDCIDIPEGLKEEVCKKGIGYKFVSSDSWNKLHTFLEANYELGYHGHPVLFNNFKRYPGPR